MIVNYSELGERVLRLQYLEAKENNDEGRLNGVTLRLKQLVTLISSVNRLKASLESGEEMVEHVGRCCFVKTFTEPRLVLDIRDHYFPELGLEQPQPTRRGVRFYGLEIEDFFDILNDVQSVWDALKTTRLCEHPDTTAQDRCYQCNPRLAGTPKHLKS